jgi:hypothetical protein
MHRLVVLAVLLVAAAPAVAGEEGPIAIRVVATATSAVAKHPAEAAVETGMWCTDKGAGESITFTFDEDVPVSRVQVWAGFERGARAGKYTDPTTVEVKAGDQAVEVALGNDAPESAVFAGKPVRAVTITIEAVAKGTTRRACLREVRFVGAGPQFLLPITGVDEAAFAELLDWSTGLDLAFRACDAGVLGANLRYPLRHVHSGFDATKGSFPKRTVTYRAARELVAACRAKDSVLAKGFAAGDASVDLEQAFLRGLGLAPGVVMMGSYGANMWRLAWVKDHWVLTEIGTVDPP